MEEGNLRSDVNVSLAPIGSLERGTRTETKNVNSLRSVERAVRYEMRRQAALLDDGVRILQETRHFHEDSGSTSPGRSKEDADDYRYFPEPDLVPIAPSRSRERASTPGTILVVPEPSPYESGSEASPMHSILRDLGGPRRASGE